MCSDLHPRQGQRRSRSGVLLLLAACTGSSAGPGAMNGNANGAAAVGGNAVTSAGSGREALPLGAAGGGAPSAGASNASGAGGSVAPQPTAAGNSAQSGSGASAPIGAAGAGATAAANSGSGGGAAAGHAGAIASAEFTLMPVGAMMQSATEFTFPSEAQPPTNKSPAFSWTGVAPEAKSLALVFRDLSAGAVKWVIWDIPPTVTQLPAGISGTAANPTELPGSAQLGSLGNQGYAGPCCAENMYEFVLWALDVEKLPGTTGQSTAQIRQTIIPAHDLASTKPVLMRRAR